MPTTLNGTTSIIVNNLATVKASFGKMVKGLTNVNN